MPSTMDPAQRRNGGAPPRTFPEGAPTLETLCLLEACQARLVSAEPGRSDEEELVCFERAIATITSLQEEARGLRRALTSRATIDQAKGMIMAERRCDADAAFQILVNMSRDTNVPLKDVARALIYQAVTGPRDSDGRP